MDMHFCPKCGSINIKNMYGKNSSESFVGTMGIALEKFRCNKCGHIGIFPIIDSEEYPDFMKKFKKGEEDGHG